MFEMRNRRVAGSVALLAGAVGGLGVAVLLRARSDPRFPATLAPLTVTDEEIQTDPYVRSLLDEQWLKNPSEQ